ncbi:hypothetical protein PAENIP36_61150 [Paenibacillus sp. P36]
MDAAKPWMARRATSQEKLLTLPIRGVMTVSNSNPDNIIFFRPKRSDKTPKNRPPPAKANEKALPAQAA